MTAPSSPDPVDSDGSAPDDEWVDMGGYRVRGPGEAPTPDPQLASGPGSETASTGAAPTTTPPVWGAPPWGAPGAVSPGQGTDGVAIAALVAGLLAGPLALVLGLVAKSRIRRSGAGGSGLATAGIVLGSIWLALVVLVVGASFLPEQEDGVDTTEVAVDDVRVGQCLRSFEEGVVRSVDLVACGSPHAVEVYASFPVGSPRWPGLDEVLAKADDGCTKRLAAYVGEQRAASGVFDVYYLYPRESDYRIGRRTIECLLAASDGKDMTRSMKA